MDMTKEFIEKIQESAAPNVVEHFGRMFVDKHVDMLPCEPVVEHPLATATLSSVSDYITHNTDMHAFLQRGRFIIHVGGPKTVALYRELNEDKRRDCLIQAEAKVNGFPFGRFMDVESFIISLQTNFVPSDNITALLGFIASVKTDTGVEHVDDGIFQKVMARSGVALVSSAKAPNPITLRPYRTFSEVEQPESPFVFRVKSNERDVVAMALFEADDCAWMYKAIVSMKEYFESMLKEQDNVIILG